MTLGCQMSSWGVEPDLSFAESSIILSNRKRSLIPNGTDVGKQSHCIMYNITKCTYSAQKDPL